MDVAGFEYGGMVKKPLDRFGTIYLSLWLPYLGRRAGEVSKKAGVDEAYMSELVNGGKKNPSTANMMAIAEELGITVNDLYKKPPEVEVRGPPRLLSPEQFEALQALLHSVPPPKKPKR